MKKIFQWYLHTPLIWLNIGAFVFGCAAGLIVWKIGDSGYADLASQIATVKAGVSGLLGMFEAFQRVMFKIIDWVMRYFPIGVFALSANCFALYGVSLLSSYFQVALSVIIGITLMIFVCYPVFVLIVCHENPYPILWKLREPILTAFVTCSSAATLPISIRTIREKLHIRSELTGFTLSLGATVNMDGVCIHLPVFAVLAANR